jgi:hypothetical protein
VGLLSFFRRLLRSVVATEAAPVPRPSGPLRIPCTGPAAIPSVADLERLAITGRHVVLQFPPDCEGNKRPMIERLRLQLPGHSVFDSGPGPGGTTCVTVLKVIDERVVLENLPLFLAAIRNFSDRAEWLCRRLAEAHGIRSENLLARRDEVKEGWRLDDWDHGFHGLECCFTNRRTGQVVDVRLAFGSEFGVLDPYFLARFIRTTPAHHEAAGLLADDFHDPCRVLEVLEGRGHLRVVEVASEMLGGIMHRGLTLDPAGVMRPGP